MPDLLGLEPNKRLGWGAPKSKDAKYYVKGPDQQVGLGDDDDPYGIKQQMETMPSSAPRQPDRSTPLGWLQGTRTARTVGHFLDQEPSSMKGFGPWLKDTAGDAIKVVTDIPADVQDLASVAESGGKYTTRQQEIEDKSKQYLAAGVDPGTVNRLRGTTEFGDQVAQFGATAGIDAPAQLGEAITAVPRAAQFLKKALTDPSFVEAAGKVARAVVPESAQESLAFAGSKSFAQRAGDSLNAAVRAYDAAKAAGKSEEEAIAAGEAAQDAAKAAAAKAPKAAAKKAPAEPAPEPAPTPDVAPTEPTAAAEPEPAPKAKKQNKEQVDSVLIHDIAQKLPQGAEEAVGAWQKRLGIADQPPSVVLPRLNAALDFIHDDQKMGKLVQQVDQNTASKLLKQTGIGPRTLNGKPLAANSPLATQEALDAFHFADASKMDLDPFRNVELPAELPPIPKPASPRMKSAINKAFPENLQEHAVQAFKEIQPSEKAIIEAGNIIKDPTAFLKLNARVAAGESPTKLSPAERMAWQTQSKAIVQEAMRSAEPEEVTMGKDLKQAADEAVKEIDKPAWTPPEEANLPPELQKSAPRSGQTELNFKSDLDRALYIVSGPGKSKAHDQFVSWLKGFGLTDGDIRTMGKAVRQAVRDAKADPAAAEVATIPAIHGPESAPPIEQVAAKAQDGKNYLADQLNILKTIQPIPAGVEQQIMARAQQFLDVGVDAVEKLSGGMLDETSQWALNLAREAENARVADLAKTGNDADMLEAAVKSQELSHAQPGVLKDEPKIEKPAPDDSIFDQKRSSGGDGGGSGGGGGSDSLDEPMDFNDFVGLIKLGGRMPGDARQRVINAMVQTTLGVGSGAADAKYSYDNDPYKTDDQTARILRSLANGFFVGLGGASLGHALAGGTLRAAPERFMTAYVNNLLGTGAFFAKGVNDAFRILASGPIRSLDAAITAARYGDAPRAVSSMGEWAWTYLGQAAGIPLGFRKGIEALTAPSQGARWIREQQNMLYHIYTEAIDEGVGHDEAMKLVNEARDNIKSNAIPGFGEKMSTGQQRLIGFVTELARGMLENGQVMANAHALSKFKGDGKAVERLIAEGKLPDPKATADRWLLTYLNKTDPAKPQPEGVLGKLSYNLAGAVQESIPGGKAIEPFRLIGANALQAVMNSIPFVGITGYAGHGDKSMLLAEQVFPWMIAGSLALGFNVAGSNVVGAGPVWDKNRFATWRQQGHIPWSVQLPVVGWVRQSELPPPAQAVFRMMGAMNDARQFPGAMDHYGPLGIPKHIGEEFGSMIQDIGFMPRLLETLQQYSDPAQAAKGLGKSFLSSTAGSVIPAQTAIGAQAQRIGQPDTSSGNIAQNALANIKSRLPGFQQEPPTRQNTFGDNIPNPKQGAAAFTLGSFARQDINPDPVIAEYLDAGAQLPTLKQPKDFVIKDNGEKAAVDSSDFEKVPLTDDEMRTLNKQRGQIVRAEVEKLNQQTSYLALDKEHQKQRLEEVGSEATKRVMWDYLTKPEVFDQKVAALEATDPKAAGLFKADALKFQLDDPRTHPRYIGQHGEKLSDEQADQADLLLKKYSGQQKVPTQVAQLREAKKAAEYQKAIEFLKSPLHDDYQRYYGYGAVGGNNGTAMTDKQWEQYKSGNLPVKPYKQGGPDQWKAYDTIILLARYVPSWDPRKAKIEALKKQILKTANPEWRMVLNRDVLQRQDVKTGVFAVDTAAEDS